jgi:CheY-like chemotaxis protein
MPHSAVNVLLVEDDDVDTESMQRAFAKFHLANPLTVAIDGYDALDILRGDGGNESLPQPYIIILDLQMPRMNGLEFLHALRQDSKLKSSVVFVLTTSDNEEDMLAAYGEQAAGYFLKKNAGQEFSVLPGLIQNYCQMVAWPKTLQQSV